MIEQPQPESKTDAAEAPKHVDSRETLPGSIALWGSLLAGVLGIIKATQTEDIAAAACLFAAVAGFGVTYYIHSRKE